jgi:hypothetical protein
VYFSFNNTVDPAWSLSPETEPTSRRERRVARVAAEGERRRLAHLVGGSVAPFAVTPPR